MTITHAGIFAISSDTDGYFDRHVGLELIGDEIEYPTNTLEACVKVHDKNGRQLFPEVKA